jgi:hypothetical protein
VLSIPQPQDGAPGVWLDEASGVSCSSTTSCALVGTKFQLNSAGTGFTSNSGFAETLADGTWTVATVPPPGTNSELNGVDCTSQRAEQRRYPSGPCMQCPLGHCQGVRAAVMATGAPRRSPVTLAVTFMEQHDIPGLVTTPDRSQATGARVQRLQGDDPEETVRARGSHRRAGGVPLPDHNPAPLRADDQLSRRAAGHRGRRNLL